MANQRNNRIDILRAIGSVLLILAHVDPPHMLSEIRSFDVVLLAILSGMSVGISSSLDSSYHQYVLKRVKRLVLPTYVCISFIFIATSLLCLILHRELLYNIDTMLYSYIFAGRGMGYVWIVKVYLIMALFTFPLVNLNSRIESDYIFIGLLTCGIVIQSVLIRMEKLSSIFLLSDYIFYIIPYVAMEAIGIRWVQGSHTFKKIFTLFVVVIFTLSTVLLGKFEPSLYKYPPDFYYIVYGTAMTCLLLHVVPNKHIKLIEYISRNSFDVYLIHIIVLLIYNFSIDVLHLPAFDAWWLKFLIVTALSILLTIPLNKIKKKVGIIK